MTPSQQFPKLGVSACVWRNGRVLIVKRGKPPLAGHWSLPGGQVEPGETVLEAAYRELREETGIEARLSQLTGVYDLIRRDETGNLDSHYVIAVYAGFWLAGGAIPASDAAAVQWANPDELSDFTFTPNVREAIARARSLLNL